MSSSFASSSPFSASGAGSSVASGQCCPVCASSRIAPCQRARHAGAAVGGIAGAASNQVVQPCQVLEFYRDLTQVAGWQLETAGVLKGGRRL